MPPCVAHRARLGPGSPRLAFTANLESFESSAPCAVPWAALSCSREVLGGEKTGRFWQREAGCWLLGQRKEQGLLQADVLCLNSSPFPAPAPAISLASEARSPLAADSPPAFVEGGPRITHIHRDVPGSPPKPPRLMVVGGRGPQCAQGGKKKKGRSKQRGWEKRSKAAGKMQKGGRERSRVFIGFPSLHGQHLTRVGSLALARVKCAGSVPLCLQVRGGCQSGICSARLGEMGLQK